MPRPMYFLAMLDHKSKVGLGQRVLGVLVALLDELGVLHLLLGAEQGNPPNLFEVHAHRVVEGHRVDGLGGGHQLLVVLHHGEVLVAVGDLDAHVPEDLEDALQMVGFDIHLGETREDVVGGEVAGLLAADDELLGGEHEGVGGEQRAESGAAVGDPDGRRGLGQLGGRRDGLGEVRRGRCHRSGLHCSPRGRWLVREAGRDGRLDSLDRPRGGPSR